MRRQLGEGFAEFEIVAEFGAGLFLPLRTREVSRPLDHISSRKRTNEIRVLGEPLDQNGARTFERGGRVRHLLFGVDEDGGRRLRLVLRMASSRSASGSSPASLAISALVRRFGL